MESQHNKIKVRLMKLGRLILLAPLFTLVSCGDLANFYRDVYSGYVPESVFVVQGHSYIFDSLSPDEFEGRSDLLTTFQKTSISFALDSTATIMVDQVNEQGTYNQYGTIVTIVVTSVDGNPVPEEDREAMVFTLNNEDLVYSFDHNNVSVIATFVLDE